MNALETTRSIVRSCLQLDEKEELTEETYLIGNFPEFNSLTITTIVAEIEDRLGVDIEDDELSAEIFETVGSLADFVRSKSDDS